MVSSARASTSRPSRVNFTLLLIASPVIYRQGWAKREARAHRDIRRWARFVLPTLRHSPSPASERLLQLVRKILQHAHQRVRRCLSKSANRSVAHGGRQLAEQRLVPRAGRHQLHGLLSARPAGRALAAALILEELHQIESHSLDVVPVRQDHNRVRPDEATIWLQRAEIERPN